MIQVSSKMAFQNMVNALETTFRSESMVESRKHWHDESFVEYEDHDATFLTRARRI